MARTGYDEKEVIEWIPPGEEFDKDPFTVFMTHVGFKQVQAYAKRIGHRVTAQSKGVRDLSKITDISAVISGEVQKEQFCENVKRIKNYFVKGREITDAEEFFEVADNACISEIIAAMESSAKLSEGQVKNSPGASDGGTVSTEKTEPPLTAQDATTETKETETVKTG